MNVCSQYIRCTLLPVNVKKKDMIFARWWLQDHKITVNKTFLPYPLSKYVGVLLILFETCLKYKLELSQRRAKQKRSK